jgi:hypothetical protein
MARESAMKDRQDREMRGSPKCSADDGCLAFNDTDRMASLIRYVLIPSTRAFAAPPISHINLYSFLFLLDL